MRTTPTATRIRKKAESEIDWDTFESISETLLTDIEATPGETENDLLYGFEDQPTAKTVLAILARTEVCVDSAGRHFINQEAMDRFHATERENRDNA